MSYPWPSFGSFLFTRDERPVWESDASWVRTPSYARQRPLGTATDVITTLAIGSAERSFEVYLSPARFDALESRLGTKAVFTDWSNPTPDSRLAFLSEVTALGDQVSAIQNAGRKRHTRITLVSA